LVGAVSRWLRWVKAATAGVVTGQLQAGLPYQGHAATATKRHEGLCTDCSPVLLLTCVLYTCPVRRH
jgi:hypothetical protein